MKILIVGNIDNLTLRSSVDGDKKYRVMLIVCSDQIARRNLAQTGDVCCTHHL